MKLIRFRENGKVKPGVIISDRYYDTSEIGEDYNEQFFETGGLSRLQKLVNEKKEQLPEIKNVDFNCPFARPSYPTASTRYSSYFSLKSEHFYQLI